MDTSIYGNYIETFMQNARIYDCFQLFDPYGGFLKLGVPPVIIHL